ncbi:MAG: amino acid-binding protein [Zetaproteobacteria bacterium CG12_big_fil_rev_8_21_14_0_65_55_1124]|nr:MAG: amino acid-binding protein [Zetaproteobacteria bacterium CG1_02_55_237]PIS19812.1 MAG: amino acid-binding protein [Zetaproteobacteria bacterium CG08_land_8_20_14_0_20_55_17]PIW42843.1 MAG: amino acid-binding protein [Zetaproteobacteria bacterium CG12_big_fil_rev_8_21_14_0_65_55_1124]PIY51659.1 MAG: amino acid-binding protein [Zetaproteobacteria bacterium CG_4_10_14_0_8_um_filter_55_43]PIZ39832.1 MAG: amino acid-binding protein [Zetaproteobacteria bacterium CG_4_10_14_0_2_um_filter_55_20
MSSVLLSISGHDRPGIVRDVSEALLELDTNIEDSSMTALRGRFAMMLIVSLGSTAKLGELKAAMAHLEQKTGLHVQSTELSDEEFALSAPEPDCVVTVNGSDQPGIVHTVTDALASLDASVVDLSTRSRQYQDGNTQYMMALEVAAGDSIPALRERLAKVADKLDVDIEVHVMDEDVL